MASVFTIVIASMIFLVSGSSDSQGNPLLSSREKDYDAVTKVVNEMFPFLCDNEQCRHGAQLHAKSGSVSDSSEPIDIDVYFLRFVNRILGELVKGIMSNGVPESERTAMTVHLKKKLINVMVAATVFLHNPMQALDNAMSIFKPPSDNAQKAKEVIDRYANMGSHEGLFSDLDLPQHVAHLGQKLVESGADAEALAELLSFFEHSSSNMRLVNLVLRHSYDVGALQNLFRFFNDFPNAARIVIRAINAGCHIGSAAPLLQDLYKTVHPRYDHYIVSFLFTIATFLQNMHVMNGTWTRVNQTRQILKNYFFNF
uniref:Uncharacterized protein n=1 Tax=Spongospora subterranea TaxID=70186 RepID=A0A0H5R399_9EUKA|eukprot:CRZ08391.1 hypothetical protein [Spongospora subterranea]